LNPAIPILTFYVANILTVIYENNPKTPLIPPPKKASIIIPVWCEPDQYLENTFKSLKNQTVVKAYPEKFEFIVIGQGFNLNLAKKYADKIIIQTKRGKLTARHQAIEKATGEIIVSVDADSIYHQQWLNIHLQQYYNHEVVATTSPTFQGMLEPAFALIKHPFFASKISGRGSTMLKSAYNKIGGFNLNINQTNLNELLHEEEFNLYKKLSKIGRIVYLPSPPIIHQTGYSKPRGLRSQ